MIPAEELDRRLHDLARMAVPVWLFDVERLRFVWANERGLTLWKADDVDELIARDLSREITPAVRDRLRQHCEDLCGSATVVAEHWTFFPQGEPRSYECLLSAFDIAEDRPWLMIQATGEGLRPEKDTLYRANALLRTSVYVSVFDSGGELLYANPAGREMLGRRPDTLACRFLDAADWKRVSRDLEAAGQASIEARMKTDRGVAWHRITLDGCPDPVTGEHAILVSEFDISERHAAEEKVHELAYTDPLTGLGNRTLFVDELETRLAEARRYGHRLSVLFIDLDRFKLINDTLGHTIGDRLLNAVARRLECCVGTEHRVARLGGDEFTVLSSGPFDEQDAVDLGQSICAAMEMPLEVGEYELQVTPSIGLSMFPEHGDDPSTLMQQADLAMYDAKACGGGLKVFRPSLDINVRNRLSVETDLRKALRLDQLEVFYQPKVCTRTLQIVGQEALVRWRHPERGLVPPVEFIGIAEETGLISHITRFVLDVAMRQQREWHALGFDVTVAINVSAQEFRSGDIISTVQQTLASTGCRPESVELEITESMLMADGDSVLCILGRMKGLGIKLSIDDFGTGYSNLGYLRKFPLDSLKVDRAFIADSSHHAVLGMIIGMGKMLSLSIVAEGVETHEQLGMLIEADCDEVQGFLFSKPLPAAEATGYLATHRDWAASARRGRA